MCRSSEHLREGGMSQFGSEGWAKYNSVKSVGVTRDASSRRKYDMVGAPDCHHLLCARC